MKVRVTVWLLLPAVAQCIEPISIGIGAALGFASHYGMGWFSKEKCQLEGNINVIALAKEFDDKIFGQHLAKQVILKTVPGYLRNKNPKKPLVLSFHGWTGTGKNYISQILTRHIYPEGQKSKYVHQFVATLHFPLAKHVPIYKEQLQSWIRGNVSECERSVFIFDEMDKMYSGLIDSILPFLCYNEVLDGISYRKAIFIFLSNSGGEYISEVALRFRTSGEEREDITLNEVEHHLSELAFTSIDGGLHQSRLIDENLIDFFVPFFPLEKTHVKLCVRAELQQRGYNVDEDFVSKVAEDMIYFPKDRKIYSEKGCRTIAAKLDYYYSF